MMKAPGLLSIALLITALSGCSTEPEAIQSFCTELRSAVLDSQGCSDMGPALMTVIKKHRGERYVGESNTDDMQAYAPCEEARPRLVQCSREDEGVREAMRLLNRWP